MRIFCFYIVRNVQSAELPDGPYIIVANHTSYLDIFFMYSMLPKHPFVFLGKSEILTYPIIRTYFKNLNINAIELMPVMEFEGNESWGYNTSYHLSLDKFYGTKNKLKEFLKRIYNFHILIALNFHPDSMEPWVSWNENAFG